MSTLMHGSANQRFIGGTSGLLEIWQPSFGLGRLDGTLVPHPKPGFEDASSSFRGRRFPVQFNPGPEPRRDALCSFLYPP
jgi:hypothetical protein